MTVRPDPSRPDPSRSDPSRRTLSAAGAASLLAAAAPARAIPVPLPFGGKRKPAVDLGAIQAATGVPALAAAVVTREGFAFRGAVGRRRTDRTELVTVADPWHLGSNTKAMTAALYGRYVEAGRAAWGARLTALLPDLKPDAAWSEVRIDDLLAHRSGISDRGALDADFLAGARASALSARDQRTDVARVLLAHPPALPVGAFEYANLNYVLAGAVIERIAKRPWEEAIAADLFKPCGMSRAGFGAPTGAAPWGHQDAEGRLAPVDPSGIADNPPVLAPAGEVHASLDDYARFVRLFLTDGGGVLKPETLNRLARPYSGGDEQYGMGWQVLKERGWAQGPVLQHEGSNTLWHASVTVAPARSLAVIACSNTEAGGGPEACLRATLALVKAYA